MTLAGGVRGMPDVVGQMPERAMGEVDRYLRDTIEQIRRNPLKYGHRPHAMQERMLASRVRRRIIVAANRVGKTESGMREVLWSARGEHPYKRVRPLETVWVGSPDFPSYVRFHLPAFQRWCPPEWIVGHAPTEHKRLVKIRRADGGICTIHFLSYDMPRSKWQGAGVDAIWLDEEMPEDIVGECLARIVTTRGWILLTFTPVEGVGWWYDRLWTPAVESRSAWQPFSWPLAEFDEANEADFNVGRSLVPHLDREQIIEFASEYPDPDDRAVRIFGQVVGRKGLVYKAWRRHVHMVPRFEVPEHWEWWGAVDPGYHGFAALVTAISPGGRVYAVEEYFSQQQTTEARFRGLQAKIRSRLSDQSAKAPPLTVVFFVDTEDPQTVLELNTVAARVAEEHTEAEGRRVQLAFASLDQGLKARKAGFLRVQQTIQPVQNRDTPPQIARPRPPEGEPLFYVFDDLESEWQGEDEYHRESRLVWEIERYSWKEPPKGSTVTPDDANEDSAHGAHAMATLRYLIMARLGPPPEPEDTQEKLDQMPRHTREVWEDFHELEEAALAEAGLL